MIQEWGWKWVDLGEGPKLRFFKVSANQRALLGGVGANKINPDSLQHDFEILKIQLLNWLFKLSVDYIPSWLTDILRLF